MQAGTGLGREFQNLMMLLHGRGKINDIREKSERNRLRGD
jgi:hypothetical protein